jgi:hypothetical protein
MAFSQFLHISAIAMKHDGTKLGGFSIVGYL